MDIQKRWKQRLMNMAEPAYRDFSARLLPDGCALLGVRLPKIRALAKEISSGDWRAFLRENDGEFFEERMLEGMVIGCAPAAASERLELAAAFIPRIDNWSICDSFCAGLKLAKKEPETVWEFLQPYLRSPREYEARFAVVMLLFHYIDERHFEAVLKILDEVRHEGYYVKMAVAWALSVCYIRRPQRMDVYFQAHHLDEDTYRKALQKIIESRRVDAAAKERIRSLRRVGRKIPRSAAENLRVYETTLGRVGIAGDEAAVTRVFFAGADDGGAGQETEPMRRAAAEICAYMEGRLRSFTVPTAARGTPFQCRVWQALRDIPYGETRSYKEIAANIGSPRACRAVGLANNRNPIGIIVPCHRVIGANGALTGYAGGLKVKQRLLELEKRALESERS